MYTYGVSVSVCKINLIHPAFSQLHAQKEYRQSEVFMRVQVVLQCKTMHAYSFSISNICYIVCNEKVVYNIYII